jgi:hypothetical protein
MSNSVLDNLESQQEQAAPNVIDRAQLFKTDPEIIKAVEGYKAEIAAIRQADEESRGDVRRAAKLNEILEDSEIRNAIQQWREMAALPAKIEAGINENFINLTDAHFDFLPYPRSKDEWAIVVRRMAHRLGAACYFGAPAMAMRRCHEQVLSRLAEIDRTTKAQGVNPFAKKRTAEVMPEAMSSDALDIRIRAQKG